MIFRAKKYAKLTKRYTRDRNIGWVAFCKVAGMSWAESEPHGYELRFYGGEVTALPSGGALRAFKVVVIKRGPKV